MDSLTPLEQNWDGWRLDMELSSSEILYAWVDGTQEEKAIELGWLAIGLPSAEDRLMLLVKDFPFNPDSVFIQPLLIISPAE